MARLSTRSFEDRDVQHASALLAARHGRDAARIPAAAEALKAPNGCVDVIGPLSARAEGAVAERDGRVVGFLFGARMMLPPDNFASQFVPPHSISLPVEGHAAVAAEDATEVYRELYRFLAGGWVDDGFFVHRWNMAAGDADVQEALVSLGFGRVFTAATRLVKDAVVGRVSDAVDVRKATEEDIGIVNALSEELLAHHNRAPMFWPTVKTASAGVEGFNLAMLQAGDPPYFLGYVDGEPRALQTFTNPGFTPPIVEPDPDVYLFEGMVSAEIQAGGVGTAMLQKGMEWAADAGFETCTLHFASQNYSGGPCWLKQGFVPVEHTMDRTVDQRVLWGR